MEERANVMTDNQFDNIIKMVMLIVGRCETSEDALNALKLLLRNDDAAAVFEELEKFKKGK